MLKPKIAIRPFTVRRRFRVCKSFEQKSMQKAMSSSFCGQGACDLYICARSPKFEDDKIAPYLELQRSAEEASLRI